MKNEPKTYSHLKKTLRATYSKLDNLEFVTQKAFKKPTKITRIDNFFNFQTLRIKTIMRIQ